MQVPYLVPQSGDALGVFQSDIVVRTALLAAMADLRANPWLLDYVFASLKKDGLTQAIYGAEVQAAREWFLHTNIRVVMNTQMNSGNTLPCLSIELASSAEVVEEATLGDTHYQAVEDVDTVWPDLCTAFTPLSWDFATQTLVIPELTSTQVDLVAGLVLVDAAGNQYPVMSVSDAQTAVLAGGGENLGLSGCVLRGPRASAVRHMESSSFRETYTIGIHVHGRPVLLTYLHSIIVFCLLRYKEVLLEQRGFERSSFSSSEAARNAFFAEENVFSRYVSLSGNVRQYWPKLIAAKLTSLELGLGAEGGDGIVDPVWPLPNTSAYGFHGNLQVPGAPDDNGPPDGAQGPAVAPQTNGQMDSDTETLGPDVEDTGAPIEDDDASTPI